MKLRVILTTLVIFTCTSSTALASPTMVDEFLKSDNPSKAVMDAYEEGRLGKVLSAESLKQNPKLLGMVAGGAAQAIGLDKSSPLYEIFEKQILTAINEKKALNHNPEPRVPKKIIKHIKVGAGEPLPTAAEVSTAKANFLEDARTRITKVKNSRKIPTPRGKAKGKSLSQVLSERYTPKKLPSCKKSKTEKKSNAIASKLPENHLVFDLLFLNSVVKDKYEDWSVEDYATEFGKQTNVHFYSTQRGDMISNEALNYGATCLPFRVRITKDSIHLHDGADALKNFDAGIEGEGIFGPKVGKEVKAFW